MEHCLRCCRSTGLRCLNYLTCVMDICDTGVQPQGVPGVLNLVDDIETRVLMAQRCERRVLV